MQFLSNVVYLESDNLDASMVIVVEIWLYEVSFPFVLKFFFTRIIAQANVKIQLDVIYEVFVESLLWVGMFSGSKTDGHGKPFASARLQGNGIERNKLVGFWDFAETRLAIDRSQVKGKENDS